MRRVIIESPYAGEVDENVSYARACMADCFRRGEAPFASHLLYTQPGVLRDDDKAERALGIAAGLMWGAAADATVAYMDRGLSSGMAEGIMNAWEAKRPVDWRWLRWTHHTAMDDLVAEVERLTGRRRPALARLISDVAEAIERYGDDAFDYAR